MPLVALLLFLSAWPAAITERIVPGLPWRADGRRGGAVIDDAEGRLARALADAGAARRLRRRAARRRARARWLRARRSRPFVAFAGFVTAGVFAGVVFDRSAEAQRSLIAESITRDRLGALAAIVIAGAGVLAVLVSWGERRRDHVGEYYALLAAAGAGMVFFVRPGT